MSDSQSTISENRRPDLLPNEQEISYDRYFEFIQRNKVAIIALFLLVAGATVGFVIWSVQEEKIQQISAEQYAKAETLEDFQKVIADYPKSEAALLASMRAGELYFEKGQWDEARAIYESVAVNWPLSPLVPSALIGSAATYESTGKMDEALKTYDHVVSNHPKSFQAPHALVSKARILESQGKLPEARKALEDLISNYPDSTWRQEADFRLQKLRPLIAAQAPADSEAPKAATAQDGAAAKSGTN
jgi:TolA-binding protein